MWQQTCYVRHNICGKRFAAIDIQYVMVMFLAVATGLSSHPYCCDLAYADHLTYISVTWHMTTFCITQLCTNTWYGIAIIGRPVRRQQVDSIVSIVMLQTSRLNLATCSAFVCISGTFIVSNLLFSFIRQVWRVSWNITGTILASSGDDGCVRLWKGDFIYLENYCSHKLHMSCL